MDQFLEEREIWTKEFSAMSAEELIDSFNGKVGLKTYGVLLSIHLDVLKMELLSRNWDCSDVISICPESKRVLRVSYAFPVELVNNKLIVIKNYFWYNRKKVYLN